MAFDMTPQAVRETPLGWSGVIRLGLVQMAIGAIVILTTSTLNRVMVVELALPAALPGALVGWHYAVQLSRPRWGYRADRGGRRTPWILGGLMVLGVGAIAAALAAALMAVAFWPGLVAAVIAFFLIGVGVGAAGTNLLALLAIRTAPAHKAAAAAIVWIMMIMSFVLTAITAGSLLDPFSMGRLVAVTAGVSAIAIAIAAMALIGMEPRQSRAAMAQAPKAKLAAKLATKPAAKPAAKGDFRAALHAIWQERQTRMFTIFVFVSMLAYSGQDLILEPFAGLMFDYSPGESTRLAGVQNQGVLLGMILTALIATLVGKSRARFMQLWSAGGCVASGIALGVLALGALSAPAFPLKPGVFALGLANGAFAVAAIGSMMVLASKGANANGDGKSGSEGMRMGVWGAAQAIAFGLGGFLGAALIDITRAIAGDIGLSFSLVFALESAAFLIAAVLALRVGLVDMRPGAHDQTADDPSGTSVRLPVLPSAHHLPAE